MSVLSGLKIEPSADYPESQNPTAMSESALAQLADGSLMAVLRFDGDCGCHSAPKTQLEECGAYRYYHKVFSTSSGHTWSKAVAVNGTGCVKPRLMMLGEPAFPGPLLLTGGRMCVENVTDAFLWLNADGLGGSAASRLPPNDTWRRHSLSYVHNSLWRGDSAYKYNADINNSQVFETQSYTTLIRLGPLEALMAYNRYYHPSDGAPGCQTDKNGNETAEVCSTAFVMRITLARKAAKGPRQKTDDMAVMDDSVPQVETPLIVSADGAVLTLLNWRESRVSGMHVSVVLDFDVDRVTAVRALTTTNTELPFTSAAKSGQFVVNFTVAVLEHSDFVMLEKKATNPRQKTDDVAIVTQLTKPRGTAATGEDDDVGIQLQWEAPVTILSTRGNGVDSPPRPWDPLGDFGCRVGSGIAFQTSGGGSGSSDVLVMVSRCCSRWWGDGGGVHKNSTLAFVSSSKGRTFAFRQDGLLDDIGPLGSGGLLPTPADSPPGTIVFARNKFPTVAELGGQHRLPERATLSTATFELLQLANGSFHAVPRPGRNISLHGVPITTGSGSLGCTDPQTPLLVAGAPTNILRLKNGSYVSWYNGRLPAAAKTCGLSYFPPFKNASCCDNAFFFGSADAKDWEFIGHVAAERNQPVGFSTGPTGEGGLVELDDGRLMYTARTSPCGIALARAYSSTGGQSWTATADVPGVIGTVGPQVMRLSGGVTAMVSGRPGIGLTLSTDGETWRSANIAAEFNRRQPDPRDRFSPAFVGIGPCVGHVCAGDNGPLPNKSRHGSGCGPRCVGGAAPLPDGACPECPDCADFGGTAGEGTGCERRQPPRSTAFSSQKRLCFPVLPCWPLATDVNMLEVEPDVLLLIFDRFGGIFLNASGCPTLPTGRVDRRSPFCQHQPVWTNNAVYAMRVRVGTRR